MNIHQRRLLVGGIIYTIAIVGAKVAQLLRPVHWQIIASIVGTLIGCYFAGWLAIALWHRLQGNTVITYDDGTVSDQRKSRR